MNLSKMEQELNELERLTRIEEERELTSTESNRYLELWELLQRSGTEINFGVNI